MPFSSERRPLFLFLFYPTIPTPRHSFAARLKNKEKNRYDTFFCCDKRITIIKYRVLMQPCQCEKQQNCGAFSDGGKLSGNVIFACISCARLLFFWIRFLFNSIYFSKGPRKNVIVVTCRKRHAPQKTKQSLANVCGAAGGMQAIDTRERAILQREEFFSLSCIC